MLTLHIGNKNYSSWSMRPWVLMRQLGIAFTENRLRFDGFEPDSAFKRAALALSPSGKVPVLEDGDVRVWDTLAIVEYLAERYPGQPIWPADAQARAMARSLCADMHSGFTALRSACPMNIEATLPDVGALLWRDRAALRADVARLGTLWDLALQRSGGPLLFGDFCAADAYFAPVCVRFRTYALPLPAPLQSYVERVMSLTSVQAWVEEARRERDFLAFEEPYRLAP